MKEVKEGQFRKDDAVNDNMWEVTAVGKKDLLARVWRAGEVVQGEQRYSIGDFKDAYPVIVGVTGNPVDPEPARQPFERPPQIHGRVPQDAGCINRRYVRVDYESHLSSSVSD